MKTPNSVSQKIRILLKTRDGRSEKFELIPITDNSVLLMADTDKLYYIYNYYIHNYIIIFKQSAVCAPRRIQNL